MISPRAVVERSETLPPYYSILRPCDQRVVTEGTAVSPGVSIGGPAKREGARSANEGDTPAPGIHKEEN